MKEAKYSESLGRYLAPEEINDDNELQQDIETVNNSISKWLFKVILVSSLIAFAFGAFIVWLILTENK